MNKILICLILGYTSLFAELTSESEIFSAYRAFNGQQFYSAGLRNHTDIQAGRLSLKGSFEARTTSSSYATGLYSMHGSREKSELMLTRLYLQGRVLTKGKLSVDLVYGVIQLAGGNFKQYSKSDEIQGNMLFTLIDTTGLGGFIVISYEDLRFKIGKAFVDQDTLGRTTKISDEFDGSGGLFSALEYSYGRHFFELNYIEALTKVKLAIPNFGGPKELFKTELIGLGYSFDDSLNSGFIGYTVLGYSHRKLLDNTVPLPALKDNLTGYSSLIGLKYYTEIWLQEVSIGVEQFKTYEDYTSFIFGDLWENDYNSFGTDKISYKIYSDFVYNKRSRVHLEYLESTGLSPLGHRTDHKHVLIKLSYTF